MEQFFTDLSKFWEFILAGGLTGLIGLYLRYRAQQLERIRIAQENTRIEQENRQTELSTLSDYYADLSEGAKDVRTWIERATSAEARCEYLEQEIQRLRDDLVRAEKRADDRVRRYRKQRDHYRDIFSELETRDHRLGLNLFSDPITEEIESADEAISLRDFTLPAPPALPTDDET